MSTEELLQSVKDDNKAKVQSILSVNKDCIHGKDWVLIELYYLVLI